MQITCTSAYFAHFYKTNIDPKSMPWAYEESSYTRENTRNPTPPPLLVNSLSFLVN